MASANLESEKRRIDAGIADLRTQLGGKRSKSKAPAAKARTSKQKAKTSSAMKALWTKVHKAEFTKIGDYKASLRKG